MTAKTLPGREMTRTAFSERSLERGKEAERELIFYGISPRCCGFLRAFSLRVVAVPCCLRCIQDGARSLFLGFLSARGLCADRLSGLICQIVLRPSEWYEAHELCTIMIRGGGTVHFSGVMNFTFLIVNITIAFTGIYRRR